MTTAADILIDTLSEFGIKHIYGIVGDSLNAITDAARRKKLKWIGVRHEETAAFAAGAESQLTGQLTICAGSCGPGNLHLINGIYDCHRSGTPVLAIAAHIETSEIGSDFFQETYPQFLFKDCSYFCELVSSPDQMPRMLRMAIQTAINKRGVSVLVIPGDIALKDVAVTTPEMPTFSKSRIVPDEEELLKIANVLNESERTTLLCGIGCTGAQEEINALSETLKAPIVHTLRAKDILDFDSPANVGMTGLIGVASGYYAMEDCNTLLMLGTDFPFRNFYPSNSTIIQIDIRSDHIGRRCPTNIGVVGGVKESIQALLPLLKKKENSEFLNKATEHFKKSKKELNAFATGEINQTIIHPQYLASLISKIADESAIFSCDVGTVTIWAARYLQMNGKRRLLGSFKHGSMASAMSQAIGSHFAYPHRQIVALCGDGGFTMLMGDLITVKQLNLPIKIVIFNNSNLGMVDVEMKTAGFLNFGTELINPNFAEMANAMGIFGVRIEDPNTMEDSLREAFKHKGPALIDVITNPVEIAVPPKITSQELKGFSLYSIKAIINGQGSELFELIKSNIWK